MKSTTLTLTIPNDVIVGCMDFATETDMEVGVQNSLTAFINLMRTRGMVPDRSPEEYDQIIEKAILESKDPPDDPFANIQSFLPQKRTVADIAREVERRIETGATPAVSLGDVGEIADPIPIEEDRVNLFEIERYPLDKLNKMSPKDRFIEQAIVILLKQKTGEATDQERLFIPALEIVYSSIPQTDWGTPHAEAKINSLIQMHGIIPPEEAA